MSKLASAIIAVLLLAPRALAVPEFSERSFSQCSNMFAGTGVPENGLSGEGGILLCKTGFASFWNSRHRIADWTVERLAAGKCGGDEDRLGQFYQDKALPEKDDRVVHADYTNSGYDRGHMAAAEDQAWDETAMADSFLTTNIAPQVGVGFNQGIWKKLEERIRDWVTGREELIVFTGPIYEREKPRKMLAAPGGKERQTNISIPDAYFKIVYAPRRDRVQAFYLKNVKHSGSEINDYRISIDRIEELTGYDAKASKRDC